MRKIFYAKPLITKLEIKYVTDAISNGRGIEARPFFYPLNLFSMFADDNKGKTIGWPVYRRGINLPSYFELTADDVQYVCRQLKSLLY